MEKIYENVDDVGLRRANSHVFWQVKGGGIQDAKRWGSLCGPGTRMQGT